MRFSSTHIAAPLALALAMVLLVAEAALALRQAASSTYGVLNLLMPVPVSVESNVSQAALQDRVYTASQGNVPMSEMVGVWSRAFARAGYDYDLSLYQALRGSGVAEYENLKAYGGIAYVIPLLNALKEGQDEVLLQGGWIGEATLRAAVRFGKAIGFLSDSREAALANERGARGDGERASVSARVRGLAQLADSIVFVWLESADGEDMGEFYVDAASPDCQDALEEGSMALVEYVARDGSNWIEVCRKEEAAPVPQASVQPTLMPAPANALARPVAGTRD